MVDGAVFSILLDFQNHFGMLGTRKGCSQQVLFYPKVGLQSNSQGKHRSLSKCSWVFLVATTIPTLSMTQQGKRLVSLWPRLVSSFILFIQPRNTRRSSSERCNRVSDARAEHRTGDLTGPNGLSRAAHPSGDQGLRLLLHSKA